MWSVESGIQDDLRLTSSVQSFQVSLLEQANVLQTLEYFFRDRVITATIDSVMIKIVLFFPDSSKQYIAGSVLSKTSSSHCIMITGSPSPKLGLTVTSLTYTHTSVLKVKMPLSNASGAIHFIGSLFTLVTSYISLSFAWRNKPKSAIFTALSSPSRILRAARSRWMNPLLAKYSWQRNNES